MLCKLLMAALVAAVVVAPARAAERVLLMPGVAYERQVEFTSHGPVAIHVLTAPRPGGLWRLQPVLSNGAVVARDRLSAMQRALGGQATVAGVSGDFFADDGRPEGIVLQDGVLAHQSHLDRSSIGIARDGALRVERVRTFGTWRGTQRRPLNLNEPPGANGAALYTPAWGPVAPAISGATTAVLPSLATIVPNTELSGTVSEVRTGAAASAAAAIPPGGALLVARGIAAQRLAAEVGTGGTITVRFVLSPDWSAVPDALGGGPVLVRDGRAVFRHSEVCSAPQLGRNPRAAGGQLRDGRIVLVAVDGQQRGYSVGMTSFELARTLVRLGAVTGAGLGAGPATTMAFEAKVLNRPAGGGETPVSNGLFVLYRGVYAAPPSEPVVSPNGDSFADSTDLTYKVVRPSRVTVTLVGPDRIARQLDVADKEPGTYRLVWGGTSAAGGAEPEGRWRFSVSAVDEQGQASVAERMFSVNKTLAGLTVTTAPGRASARFTLTRAARVTASIESQSGALIAVVARRSLAAGAHSISWNGRIGAGRAARGRYVFRIAAANAVGGMDVAAAFALAGSR